MALLRRGLFCVAVLNLTKRELLCIFIVGVEMAPHSVLTHERGYMPAPEGNKYAEKYSRDEVIEKLTAAIEGLYGSSFPTYTHAILAQRLYPQLITEWTTNVYKEDAEVLALIKEAKSVAPSMLFRSTCDNTINATAGLFGLKAQYGWVEKGVELEVEAHKPYNVEWK